MIANESRSPIPKIVLTGGPGAGKTAIQQLAARHLCSRVSIVPESASILFSGGFPRSGPTAAKQIVQRAIYWVQRELEELHCVLDPDVEALLCDRGTVDGQAYWSGQSSLWDAVGTTIEAEYDRYHTVIFLGVPEIHNGYDNSNAVRIESAEEASQIGDRILEAWSGHPRVIEVPTTANFVDKARTALGLIEEALNATSVSRKLVRPTATP